MQQPLSWIRSFEATARHGNFTRAAEQLGLTQAAVSQHIKGLEERLGVQLFERKARGVTLSGVGAELYKSVAEGIGTIEAALERFGEPIEQRLHVLCNTSLTMNWLTPLLPAFLELHPDINFRLSTALWQTDAIGVRADLSIFLIPSKDNRCTEIPGGELVIVEPTSPRAPTQGIVQVTGFEKAFEALRETMPDPGTQNHRLVECNSFHTALEIARSGVGRTIAPRLLARKGIADGTLRAVGPCDFHRRTHYWAQLHSTNSTISQEFIDWIVHAAERELS